MTSEAATHSAQTRLGLLLRVKARSLWNRTRQAIHDAPVRISAAALLIGVIWFGLFMLFWMVFQQFLRTPLEATVALPLVFNFFFMAILAMLAFSNAIISYGALFSRDESAFLRALPLTPLDVVTLKYLESVAMASWSLILLGLPLMLALADMAHAFTGREDHSTFYVLFILFFFAFLPIPASLGLLLSWAAAHFLPRRAVKLTLIVCGVVAAAVVVWGVQSLRFGTSEAEVWLRSFLARMSFVQSAFLPNNWVASGIDHALHDQIPEALLYLGVTFSSAWFFSWVAVRIVARNLTVASDLAAASRDRGHRVPTKATGGLAGAVFFYLPQPLRLIAAKDLRTFFRDPMQWGQLVILFGLMVLYLTNMPTLKIEFGQWRLPLVIPFLNLCAVSLILATFTCRFVFPLVSLEGQKLWLVGLLPMRRGHVLLAKFAFAMTVTVLVAVGAMGLAAVMLELDAVWAAIHLTTTVSVCFGLCGFAVGIGARLPMFHQTNVARIANGLGGTTNLLASIALVAVVLTGTGMATYRARGGAGEIVPDTTSLIYCGAAALFSIAAGSIALWIGARHFDRVEA